MIEILRHSQEKLERLTRPEPKSWINLISPTAEELNKLKQFIKIPDEFIESLKDIEELPSLQELDNLTFITLRVPCSADKEDVKQAVCPVGIFATGSMIATISFFETQVFDDIKRQNFQFRKTQFVFRLFLSSTKFYLDALKAIQEKMYTLESELEKTQSNKVVMEFLEMEKNLVYFDTSLRSNLVLIRRIAKEGTKNRFITLKTAEDRNLIHEVIDENKQALQMANLYSNILSNTLDAFASIISNNLNVTIKFLTSLTVILALPTLIASVYGMNIDLPFDKSPFAFAIVMGITFVITITCVFLLWKRKFF
ncbi:MAG TPA: magnesium transporter CorA family protein [Candidatus Nanoarchaeia archaeon]|nr:magnesium transporter CorA family protein [Candidatus Nanoarchaeia archaeon]